MVKTNNIYSVCDSMKAWDEINQAFILGCNTDLFHFIKGHNALYAYDVVINIVKPQVDPDFDFGRYFNYTKSKWVSLVNNYINIEELKNIKDEIIHIENKNSSNKVYNLALQFTNKHDHGKNCLLSMIFSHRIGDSKAIISVYLRASEVTKRLICDLLLFQRIGEYIYGSVNDFRLVVHFNQLFNDDNVLIMYDNRKSIKNILKSICHSERANHLKSLLKKMKDTNPELIKYKVHRRAAKVLHPELYKYPKTLAKDCTLNI